MDNMFPHGPILVTLDEYYAIGFLLFITGMFITMDIVFIFNDDRKNKDEL